MNKSAIILDLHETFKYNKFKSIDDTINATNCFKIAFENATKALFDMFKDFQCGIFLISKGDMNAQFHSSESPPDR